GRRGRVVVEGLARPAKVRRKLGERQRHARCAIRHAELLRAEPRALAGADLGDAAQIGEREGRFPIAAVSRAEEAEDGLILPERLQVSVVVHRCSGRRKIESVGENFAHKRAAGVAAGGVVWWKGRVCYQRLRQRQRCLGVVDGSLRHGGILQRWKPGNVRGVSRCLLRTRAGIKLAQATCWEQRAIAFALSLWHVAMYAAEAARLRSAIERVDYGDGIAPARELLAQLHRGWHPPGRHGGTPTLEADLAPLP